MLLVLFAAAAVAVGTCASPRYLFFDLSSVFTVSSDFILCFVPHHRLFLLFLLRFFWKFLARFWNFVVVVVVVVVSRVVEFCCIVGRLGRICRSCLLIFVASVDGDLQ
jgi:hypothetical protein